MSSQSSSTRPEPPAAAPARSSVNPLTLLIAAVSAAAAAYITSKVWESGTLIATAMTPVIVALVREALEKPVERVATLGTQPLSPSRARGRATTPRGEAEPTVVRTPVDEPSHGPVTVRRTGAVRRRWVRVGLVTGLVAFLVAAVVYTGTELLTGSSSAGGDRATSIFGGSSSGSGKGRTPSTTTTDAETTDTAPSETTTAPAETTTTVTTPTVVTETVPAPAETTPPAATVPAPQTTTPTPTTTAPDPAVGAAP